MAFISLILLHFVVDRLGYYIDTSVADGNFLQIGTYINDDDGTYAQVFPEVELSGADLASGLIFEGTVSASFADKGYIFSSGLTGYEVGLILNGDGPNQPVWFDNVSITPVPEPVVSWVVLLSAFALLRRR